MPNGRLFSSDSHASTSYKDIVLYFAIVAISTWFSAHARAGESPELPGLLHYSCSSSVAHVQAHTRILQQNKISLINSLHFEDSLFIFGYIEFWKLWGFQ